MSCIIQSQWAPATATEVYVAGQLTRLDKFDARNNDTVDRVFTVHLVPAGGAADNSNIRLTAQIQSKETLDLIEIVGHDLAIGDSIHVFADVADVVSFRASGRFV
jgi:hypothetical protein